MDLVKWNTSYAGTQIYHVENPHFRFNMFAIFIDVLYWVAYMVQ